MSNATVGTIKLNPTQQLAYDTVLHGKDRENVLTGVAGTGKTLTAAEIARNYPGKVLLTATTNTAAKVLQKNTGMDVKTIHSAMGFVLKWICGKQRLVQERKPEVADLVIIDEASMLTSEVYAALIASGAKKILLLGDPVQLGPIGPGISLDGVQGYHIELTEQMRQSGLSTLTTDFLCDLRKSIEGGTNHPQIPKDSPDLIITPDHNEFARLYYVETGTKKILAYTNSCVNAYNRTISGGSILFSPGNKVKIGAPTGNAKNGDILVVVDSEEKSDRINVELSNGETVIHWKSKAAKKAVTQPLKDRKAWQEYRRVMDASIDLKHLFASTIHKAQGSGFDTVFIDATDVEVSVKASPFNHPISHNDMLRLAYVAISRMRKKVVIFIGSTRDYSKFRRMS